MSFIWSRTAFDLLSRSTDLSERSTSVARRLRTYSLTLSLLAVTACSAKQQPPPVAQPGPQPAQSGQPPSAQLAPDVSPRGEIKDPSSDGARRSRFYHLAEGSEIFPLSWLRALPGKHGPTVMSPDNLTYYGLLLDSPSVDNPQGLPVGMTLDATANSRLAGFEVVGFNCAACHVGELQAEGKLVRVDGAPNMFDIKLFNSDISDAFTTLFKSPADALAFFVGLHAAGSRDSGPPLRRSMLDALDPDTLTVYQQLPSFKELQSGGQTDKALARQIEALIKREFANAKASTVEELVSAQLGEGASRGDASAPTALRGPASLQTIGRNAADQDFAPYISPELESALAADAAPTFLKATPRGVDVGRSLRRFLADLALTTRWIAQRLQLLYHLRGIERFAENSRTGPGRVDAFGTARNMLFPAHAAETDAPVSYPHLWGFAQVTWLHWDGNTTAVVERNIGQALGLGAIVNATSGASSVQVRKIHELELFARNIAAPKWPFAAPQAADVQEGKKLFEMHCQSCHSPGIGAGDGVGVDIGTDMNRVRSFNRQVGTQKFPDALSAVLRRVKKVAFDREKVTAEEQASWEPDPSVWRETTGYPNRSLEGIWASAPYLHNGSVPTIDALLLAPNKRPTKFWIGAREYDLRSVGYVTTHGTLEFNTVRDGVRNKGNSNLGHWYPPKEKPALTEGERHALVEYLKTL